ncbi:hypothetical protein [Geoalkalibacter halelectricus]|uniref:hypothetical protein n=1 Tax=Geoalkalibacter halelectricus TaxID=2847045 RepID=UPI003D250237
MKLMRYVATGLVVAGLLAAGCSLPPETPLSRQDLARTNIYRTYKIEESPEAVLNALNRQGEVVLEGHYRQRPVYIKLLATSEGIEVTHYNR